MEERMRFVKDYRSGVFETRELCGRYGISRKTGYKWLHRFEAEGNARPRRSQSGAASV